MDEEGRDEQEVDPLTRIADALEKLSSDPEVEIESGPPVCANCGKFDPVIEILPEDGSTGKMSQVVVIAKCTECASPVYIIVDSYSVHKSRVTAVAELEERAAQSGKNV